VRLHFRVPPGAPGRLSLGKPAGAQRQLQLHHWPESGVGPAAQPLLQQVQPARQRQVHPEPLCLLPILGTFHFRSELPYEEIVRQASCSLDSILFSTSNDAEIWLNGRRLHSERDDAEKALEEVHQRAARYLEVPRADRVSLPSVDPFRSADELCQVAFRHQTAQGLGTANQNQRGPGFAAHGRAADPHAGGRGERRRSAADYGLFRPGAVRPGERRVGGHG